MATTPVAGVLGAALDEHLHQSLGLWLSLCRRGSLPYLEALWLQLQLMPFALVFMLLTAFAGTLWAVVRSGTPASARMLLAGHAGCLAATLLSPLVCPWLLGSRLAGDPSVARPTPALALAGMLASELLLTVAVAWALLALARALGPAPDPAVGPTPGPIRGNARPDAGPAAHGRTAAGA